MRPFLQRRQPLFDKALADAFDRGPLAGEGSSDCAVLRTLGCFEQDTGTGHFAGRVRPTMQQVFKLLAFLVLKCDKIFFLGIPGRPPVDRLTRLYLIDHSPIKFIVMKY